MNLYASGEVKLRTIAPSKEMQSKLTKHTKRQTVISKFPINSVRIEALIQKKKNKLMREVALMNAAERADFVAEGPIDFVEEKGSRKKFFINCTRCGEKVGYCWANNEALEEWVDLHYICWYDKKSWHGAMAVNVSRIDGSLGFECACGEDTRDFRGNRTLPPIQKQLMIEYTMVARLVSPAVVPPTPAHAATSLLPPSEPAVPLPPPPPEDGIFKLPNTEEPAVPPPPVPWADLWSALPVPAVRVAPVVPSPFPAARLMFAPEPLPPRYPPTVAPTPKVEQPTIDIEGAKAKLIVVKTLNELKQVYESLPKLEMANPEVIALKDKLKATLK